MSDAIGILALVHDACPNCGANVCLLDRGPAPTYRRLTCDGCGVSRGRASKELITFLEKFLERFGRPADPIILRSGKLHKPGSVGDDAAIATATKPKRRTKVKMNDLFPSKYLRAADLQGKPRTVVINRVSHEDFKDDGVTVKKTILHFSGNGTAPVVVNKTNWKMLVAITGADDDEDWAGTAIELRSEKVSSKGGKIVDSIRVHEAPQPKAETVKPKKAKAAPEFNDEVGF
jgi:hypothetical protein